MCGGGLVCLRCLTFSASSLSVLSTSLLSVTSMTAGPPPPAQPNSWSPTRRGSLGPGAAAGPACTGPGAARRRRGPAASWCLLASRSRSSRLRTAARSWSRVRGSRSATRCGRWPPAGRRRCCRRRAAMRESETNFQGFDARCMIISPMSDDALYSRVWLRTLKFVCGQGAAFYDTIGT